MLFLSLYAIFMMTWLGAVGEGRTRRAMQDAAIFNEHFRRDAHLAFRARAQNAVDTCAELCSTNSTRTFDTHRWVSFERTEKLWTLAEEKVGRLRSWLQRTTLRKGPSQRVARAAERLDHKWQRIKDALLVDIEKSHIKMSLDSRMMATTRHRSNAFRAEWDQFGHALWHIEHSRRARTARLLWLGIGLTNLLFGVFVAMLTRAVVEMRVETGDHVVAGAALLHGLGVPCVVVDRAATVLDANKAAVSALGTTVVGEMLTNVLIYEDPEAALEAGWSCVKSRKSGRHFVASVARLRQTDGSARFLVICEDQTPAMELEIQKKLLLQICHEARNTLTPASGVLERMLGTCGGFEDLQAMRGDVAMALTLLQETECLITSRLQLHRVLTGTYDTSANTQIVDVEALIRARVGVAAANAGPAVRFVAEAPEGIAVQLDTLCFRHLANNCLSNARKHTTTGDVVFEFLGPRDDGTLCFAVRDQGHGIAPHVLPRLFREEITTSAERGVGIGLVSSRQFARAVGGDLWLEGTVCCTTDEPTGGGSDFRFALPGRVIPTSAVSAKPWVSYPEDETLALDAIRQAHVYVVEDSDLIRKTTVAKMGKLAAKWRCCWTFHEHPTVEAILPTLDAIKGNPDAIVIVDENLQAAGGQLRGTDLILKLTQIAFGGIILSVSGDPAVSRSHLQLGAHLAIGKPLPTLGNLSSSILDCLKAHKASPSTAPSC